MPSDEDADCLMQFNEKTSSSVPCPPLTPLVDSPFQQISFSAEISEVGGEGKKLGFFSHLSIYRNPHENYEFSCQWGVVDKNAETYTVDSILSQPRIHTILDRLSQSSKNNGVDAAAASLLKSGKLPFPDRLVPHSTECVFGDTISCGSEFELICSPTLSSGMSGRLKHRNSERNFSIEIAFEGLFHPLDSSPDSDLTHDIFDIRIAGDISLGCTSYSVDGAGWLEKKYGNEFVCNSAEVLLALANGDRIVVCFQTSCDCERQSVSAFYFRRGNAPICCTAEVFVDSTWTSVVTFLTYPDECRVEIPSIGVKCSFRPIFAGQEFPTLSAMGYGYFSGCIVGQALCSQELIGASGFCKYYHNEGFESTDHLMRAVGHQVHRRLTNIYPINATEEWMRENVFGSFPCSSGCCEKIEEAIIAPVRSLTDRGGKAWRSLLLMCCCNGLSEKYFDCWQFVPLVELPHAGSLIIDDIQDNSVLRRGGECIHLSHGVPTAINAGTACYFMAPQLARIHELPPPQACRLYQLYMDVLRVGHAGQGLDILGLDHLMSAAVRTGNISPLLEALDAIHLYKTGGSVASLCTIACILLDCHSTVNDAMKSFGLNIGLAFQILDDVANIRGFAGNAKECYEDIKSGKVTYPIAVSLAQLPIEDRQRLWTILESKPQKDADIQCVLQIIGKTTALSDCISKAQSLVDASCDILDSVMPDSLSKLTIQAFCNHMLNKKS